MNYIEIKVTYTLPITETLLVTVPDDWPHGEGYGYEDLTRDERKRLDSRCERNAQKLADHVTPIVKGLFPTDQGFDFEVPQWIATYAIEDVA